MIMIIMKIISIVHFYYGNYHLLLLCCYPQCLLYCFSLYASLWLSNWPL